jgi:GTP-binding protein LepA
MQNANIKIENDNAKLENDLAKQATKILPFDFYILNLIDTPGHADFGYEVSRALAAVEGAVLLVDATQGIQAQTLANFENAKKAGLTIIGAINKIDVVSQEQADVAVQEMQELLGASHGEILRVSGKTGEGVESLLRAIVERVPAPKKPERGGSRALVFDSLFDDHKGIMAFIRVFDGAFHVDKDAELGATHVRFKIKEIGTFAPKLTAGKELIAGEIGYIATGIKDAGKLKIGDTISLERGEPLAGYEEPKPVVYVSFYPEDPARFDDLRKALDHLRLNDAALHFEPDASEVLGRGFKGGFLGQLHFEITADRLSREFGIETVHSFPSVAYEVKLQHNGWLTVTNPKDFPADPEEVLEPITKVEILTPPEYIGSILQLKDTFRFSDIEVKTVGKKTLIETKLPLADLVSDLDDKLKSLSQGFASLNYEIIGKERADVVKMEVLVAEQVVPGLTRILPRAELEKEARRTVERLKELLPREQFSQALQAAVGGKIIARETITAMKKELGNFGKNGGDRTRKMKLWKKQQRGKERLKERGVKSEVRISASIFKELLKR